MLNTTSYDCLLSMLSQLFFCSLLHLVVRLEDSYEILELFNSLNVSCDAINDLGQTALFECVKLNKFHHFKLLTDQGQLAVHLKNKLQMKKIKQYLTIMYHDNSY